MGHQEHETRVPIKLNNLKKERPSSETNSRSASQKRTFRLSAFKLNFWGPLNKENKMK
jgi:hypothetical protein